ncbi:hypothetical protein [Erythrobacter ani]|uniref:Uncharacterized protein n=1 Tax=Erythrobacter ani TaxID=2827235 RepID=A0ABS6SPM0_9SPHN|nr:hypothetical protein [Erythrobacter ani]MBV7266975.1 hypothetical protein [Erythrobacter ani]
MNGGTIILALAGLFSFFAGAYIAATGDRALGIALMAMGLIFQMMCLRHLKQARLKDQDDARR